MFAKKMISKLSNSLMIVPVTALLTYALYISILFFIEDYRANEAVYALEPVLKSSPELNGVMARFVQIAPAVFGYLFLANTNKRSYGYISIAFLLYDWAIGIYYRTNFLSLDWGWSVYAAVQDFIFFTAGSDILITLLITVLPSMYVSAIRLLFREGLDAVQKFFRDVENTAIPVRKQPVDRTPQYVGSQRKAEASRRREIERIKAGFKNVPAPPENFNMFNKE